MWKRALLGAIFGSSAIYMSIYVMTHNVEWLSVSVLFLVFYISGLIVGSIE